MTSQNGTESPAATPMQSAVDKSAEAGSYLSFVFDWTLSTLYYSSGEAQVIYCMENGHCLNADSQHCIAFSVHLSLINT